ncbi:dUTP diphosphatase [Aliikangiella coralliicola]|uniref:dUTP diphosphatase n=1 Tax=Aliikangiella coralliicola TaxID=2592383 RepID=A0A545UE73_9GAMM|nr:dUTP diphosphatase [Aliikangiella coralliicola]TQV87725.1 dUTP diphosphatase [Aliikangiella coralliicola]
MTHTTQQKQLVTMLELQNAMNKKVHEDWLNQGFEWYRAIWIECGEMLDHYGWKWWKHQSPDMEQVKLELVDIFHFGLSCRLSDSDDLNKIAETLEYEFSDRRTNDDFRTTLEDLALNTLQTKSFNAQIFAGCMQQIDMSFDELFTSYVGKNVLNFFRQDHGYKDGTYHKVWHGKEDNEHLVEVVATLDPKAEDFADKVYQELSKRYPS